MSREAIAGGPVDALVDTDTALSLQRLADAAELQALHAHLVTGEELPDEVREAAAVIRARIVDRALRGPGSAA